MQAIKKAIIPAAGFGTRFLPATKAVPKEMFPIVDTPAIELVVQECVQSGIRDICILLGRGKEAIPNHFDAAPELEGVLRAAGKTRLADSLGRFSDVRFTYLRQPGRGGTGEAIALAAGFAAGESVAVLFPDDVMFSPTLPVTAQLMQAYENTGAPILGVQKRPPSEAVLYGTVVPGPIKGRYVRVLGFKEKPKPEEVTSPYTSLGRFILTPDIFEELQHTPRGVNGELHLTDAFDRLSRRISVYAYEFEGKRYDIGNRMGFLQANIEFALLDPALSTPLTRYLEELLKRL